MRGERIRQTVVFVITSNGERRDKSSERQISRSVFSRSCAENFLKNWVMRTMRD